MRLRIALIAAVAAASLAPSGAVTPAAPEAPKAAPAAPAAIAVADVTSLATAVQSHLHTLDAELAPSAGITRIGRELPGLSERLVGQLAHTRGTTASGPRLDSLDALTNSWHSNRETLLGWIEKLRARSVQLEKRRQELVALAETWRLTRREVEAQQAPAPVIARVAEVLASIPPALERIRAQSEETLVLEDRVAAEVARCNEALDVIDQARERARGQLFVRESPAIWALRPRALADARTEIGAALATDIAMLRRFAADRSGRIAFQITLLIGLVVGLSRVNHARRRMGADTTELAAHTILDRPIAAASLLALLVSLVLYPDAPRLVWLLLGLAALIPIVVILRQALAPALAPVVYGLGAFFAIDLLRDFLVFAPFVERWMFVLEMAVAAVVLAWLGRWHPLRLFTASEASERSQWRALLIRAAFGALTAAFVLGAVGNMSLARVLAVGTLGTGYYALLLAAGMRVGEALFDVALRLRPLRLLRMVQRHRALIEQRGNRILRAFSFGAWLILSLGSFGALTPALDAGRRMLVAELTLGSVGITAGDVLAFVVIVWAAITLSSFVRFALEEEVFPRMSLGAGLPYALSSLTGYVIITVGFLLAMFALGLDLDRVTVLGGAFGVGVGFGLQNVVNNFVSGLIVLFERPIHVGDEVQIGNVQGEVRRIGIRASTIRIGEGADVIVPNSQLVAERVTNWTPVQRLRRVDIPVNVAYGTTPDAVLKVLAGVAVDHADVVSHPPPRALFLGFGDSALRFELRAWTHRLDDVPGVRSDLGVAVSAALLEAGMTIPLPQQEVHIRRE